MRPNVPPGGSTWVSDTFRRRSAAVLKIVPCPWYAASIRGRSPVMGSSAKRVAAGLSSTAPPISPMIQPPAGVFATAALTRSTVTSQAGSSVMAGGASSDVCGGIAPRWACASLMPGITSRPPASTTRVEADAFARTSEVEPTCVIRSPSMRTASAHGAAGTPVNTRAFTIAMSSAADAMPGVGRSFRVAMSGVGRPFRVAMLIRIARKTRGSARRIEPIVAYFFRFAGGGHGGAPCRSIHRWRIARSGCFRSMRGPA